MTHYADNLKKSIITTHRKITQMIYDEIERRNAAYREMIFRMAQEAGAIPSGDPQEWDVWLFQDPAMECFAALVAAAECEACAKVIDEIAERHKEQSDATYWALRDAAFAIRNRSKA